MYSFSALTGVDFPLLLEWLARPHVMEWWNDGDDTLEKVAAHYSSDSARTKRLLFYRNELPIGYFQYDLQAEGRIGIDQFIAEASLLNQGIGTTAIKEFIALILSVEAARVIVTDPDPRNARAIRCYHKVGFHHFETNRDGYIMTLDIHAGESHGKESVANQVV